MSDTAGLGTGREYDFPEMNARFGTPVAEPARWTRGDWMQTYTGRQFYPLNPRADDVDLLDIAHALGMLCRYNGHTQRFYSVAEHCVLMSQSVAPEHALWALLHDATEAYVGDMIRPLKRNMPDYCEAEDLVMIAIAEKFGLAGAPTMPPEVKDADTRILLAERNALLAEPPRPWSVVGEPLDVEIQAWSPNRAKIAYLMRFSEITGQDVMYA